jgi:TonB family protein
MLYRLLWMMCVVTMSTACKQKETPRKVVDAAEVMPRFPGCETQNLPSEKAKYYCSVENLMDWLGRYVKTPDEAIEKGTVGRAVVQFIVNEDGFVEFVDILEDPGDGLGEEAARLVKKMVADSIRWRPGYQDGQPVAVRFNLPVEFNQPLDPDTGRRSEN